MMLEAKECPACKRLNTLYVWTASNGSTLEACTCGYQMGRDPDGNETGRYSG